MANNDALYLCDPEKNITCGKKCCHYKGRGDCRHTIYPAFARNFKCLSDESWIFVEIEPNAKPQVSEAL